MGLVALLAEGVDRNVFAHKLLPVLPQSPSSRRAWIEMYHCETHDKAVLSPSSRRAWIEISASILHGTHAAVALLAEGVDRNIYCATSCRVRFPSPSSRRAWIEISGWMATLKRKRTSPSSRRAWIEIAEPYHWQDRYVVALLAEGVDRNCIKDNRRAVEAVALLAEGVDRNRPLAQGSHADRVSPSSRRAWIEIAMSTVMAKRSCGRPPRGGRG